MAPKTVMVLLAILDYGYLCCEEYSWKIGLNGSYFRPICRCIDEHNVYIGENRGEPDVRTEFIWLMKPSAMGIHMDPVSNSRGSKAL